jgi:hypothetical protein
MYLKKNENTETLPSVQFSLSDKENSFQLRGALL